MADGDFKIRRVLKLWKSKSSVTFRDSMDSQGSESPTYPQSPKVSGSKFMKVFRKVEPNSLEDISLTSQRLCEEYIDARLKRSGVAEEGSFSSVSLTEYSIMLQNMGQILELRYPKLYSKISCHLKISYESEAVVWDAFNKVAAHMFSDGVTWARIIALYAFAGGLAVDCVAHGRGIFLGKIVGWLGSFVLRHLAKWIQDEGGWDALIDHFERRRRPSYFKVEEKESTTINFLLIPSLQQSKSILAAAFLVAALLVVLIQFNSKF